MGSGSKTEKPDRKSRAGYIYFQKSIMVSQRIISIIVMIRAVTRKTAKAFFLLIFDWNEFRKRIEFFLLLLKHHGPKMVFTGRGSIPAGKARKGQIALFPESALAHSYCVGRGLEIGGSAHNPFGLNTLNVDYSDSMETASKKNEISLCGRALKVDIVANGDEIPLPDESQDFIVSSHVIEHFTNPIKALMEWDRLVKSNGIIFIVVPHKERTFEKEKECTSLEHLIEDFRNKNIQPHGRPHGHEHCWITESFVELIVYMIEKLDMRWEIVEVQDVDDKVGNGFTVVIRKIETSGPENTASRFVRVKQ